MKPLLRGFFFCSLFALMPLVATDDIQTTPGLDYKNQAGLGNDSKAMGTADKDKSVALPRTIQVPQNTVKKEEPTRGVTDYTNAVILQQIESRRAKSVQLPQTNLIALPEGYSKELVAYNKALATQQSSSGAAVKEKIDRLFFMQCRVAQDYKINTDTTIKMFCKDIKSPDLRYQLNASLAIETTKLVSAPYMLESENGEVYSVNKTKSRLYNAANGSKNLATFVDRRVFDKAEQGAATAFATDAPTLAKDYIDKKSRADTVLMQTNNGLNSTITQSTQNPKPQAGDYGIALLISMMGKGIKSGVDQLYLDLGYIYYIPKDTVIEAEIVIEVEK